MVPQIDCPHRQAPRSSPDRPSFHSFQSVGWVSEMPKWGGPEEVASSTAEVGVCLFTGLCTGPRRTSLITSHCLPESSPQSSIALSLSNRKHPYLLPPRYFIVVQYASSRILNRQSKAHSYAVRLPHYTNPRSSPLFQLRASCLSRFLGRYARIRNCTPQSPPRRTYPLCDKICNRFNEFAMK